MEEFNPLKKIEQIKTGGVVSTGATPMTTNVMIVRITPTLVFLIES